MNNKTQNKENNKKEEIAQKFLEELIPIIKTHEIEANNNLLELESEETAEVSLLRELKQRTKIFGMEHPYSMQVFNVLGRFYSDRKDFKGMANLLRRSLESRINQFGVDDLNTLFTMNKLGRKLAMCAEYKEAEKMFRKSLEGFGSLLGFDHHITIRCRTDLKRLLKIQASDSSLRVLSSIQRN